MLGEQKQHKTVVRHLSEMRNWILLSVSLIMALALLFGASSAAAGGRPLSAILTGEAEVPGPGDPDGSGTASLTLNQGQGEICFELTVFDIGLPATGAHIHEAPAGVAGDVVVVLTPPDESGLSSGCVSVDGELVKAIRKDPSAYYVNVHNEEFPDGAIRGQLSK